MNKRDLFYLFARYLILIVLGISNLYLFYLILTPLTVYPVLVVLGAFQEVIFFHPNTILINGLFASIVPACVAGAAYYLLLILNISTPMDKKTRTKSIIFLILTFLIINVIRISLFAHLFSTGFKYFDLAHTTTWYFGSTIMVILIWFANVKIFKIRQIPIYSDIKSLYNQIKTSKYKK